MTNAETVARRADPDANAVERLDMEAVVTLVPPKESALARAARAVSKLGDEPPVFAAALIPLAAGVLRRDEAMMRRGAHLLAAVSVAYLAKEAVKHTVARTRPSELLEHGRHEVRLFGPDRKEWQSFPSGHLSCSTALGRAWARCWPGARWPAAGAVTVLALTRVPAGGHYPSDVAAGVVVGLAAEALAEWLVPAERQEDRPGERR